MENKNRVYENKSGYENEKLHDETTNFTSHVDETLQSTITTTAYKWKKRMVATYQCSRHAGVDFDSKKCIMPIQHGAIADTDTSELENLRKENRTLREKNKALYEYGFRKLNFKFDNFDIIRKPNSGLEELHEENEIWRRRNKAMYRLGVKSILKLK